MINVLVVDDSQIARHMVSELINATSGMQVIGEADNGQRALTLVQKLNPEVILLDLFMPHFNGIEVTKEIMNRHPTPIVIMSGGLSDSEKDRESTVQALRFGALAVVKKPRNLIKDDENVEAKSFVNTIRSMSSVRVIHHHKQFPPLNMQTDNINLGSYGRYDGEPRIVVIGVSTGGPGIIASIIADLPQDFPLPIVIVQHITERFLPSLVTWLDSVTPLKVKLASEKEIPKSGHIYFAPIGSHLVLTNARQFKFEDSPKALHTPSIDVLFESIAEVYRNQSIGIILSGMGEDGAKGLKMMLDKGAYTIAQNEATSIVFGMPKAAIALGAASKVAALKEIPYLLKKITQKKA